MHDLIPLRLLAVGQRAVVGHLLGRPDEVKRLEEMGVRCGAPLEMLQSGSPCIIRVAGGKLCFRNGELLNILVRLGEPA